MAAADVVIGVYGRDVRVDVAGRRLIQQRVNALCARYWGGCLGRALSTWNVEKMKVKVISFIQRDQTTSNVKRQTKIMLYFLFY